MFFLSSFLPRRCLVGSVLFIGGSLSCERGELPHANPPLQGPGYATTGSAAEDASLVAAAWEPPGLASGNAGSDRDSAPDAAVGSGPAAQNDDGRCPPEMVPVLQGCIDRFEAHLVVTRQEGQEVVHPYYERVPKDVRYRAASSEGVYPQAYINRSESERACANAGKRLCTLSEWYRACTGARGSVYPYGNSEVRRRCNSGKAHLLSKFFGTDSSAWSYDKHFNNPMLNQQAGFLAKTGEYSECASPDGVMDMVGNVHEWVSDRVDSSLPHKLPLQEDIHKKVGPRTGNAIFMGGFFSTTSEHGRGCRFVTIGHEATYHDYSTGFRCCQDAQRSRSGKAR